MHSLAEHSRFAVAALPVASDSPERSDQLSRGDRGSRTSPLLRIRSGQFGQTRTDSFSDGENTRTYCSVTNPPQFAHSGMSGGLWYNQLYLPVTCHWSSGNVGVSTGNPVWYQRVSTLPDWKVLLKSASGDVAKHP